MDQVKNSILFCDEDFDSIRAVRDHIGDNFPHINFLNATFLGRAQELFDKNGRTVFLVLVEDHFAKALELVHWLRNVGYAGIIATHYDVPSLANDLLEAGCNEVIAKPFGTESLDNLIKKAKQA